MEQKTNLKFVKWWAIAALPRLDGVALSASKPCRARDGDPSRFLGGGVDGDAIGVLTTWLAVAKRQRVLILTPIHKQVGCTTRADATEACY